MLQFDAAPAVPFDYPRLDVLSADEIAQARTYGYVADFEDPGAPVSRAGRDISHDPTPEDDLEDWRTRMYLVWFCYVFENLGRISRPMGAIEELILEFRAPELTDLPHRRLGTLYAGAGADDPLSNAEREQQIEELAPHYRKALALLAQSMPRSARGEPPSGPSPASGSPT